MFLLKLLMKVLLLPVMLVLFVLRVLVKIGIELSSIIVVRHRSADVAIHVDPDCHGGSPDHSDCRCRNAGCTSGGSQYQPWFIDAILKFFRY